jgi:RNA polymerase sigma-70 factor (ECF subfamily)
VFSKPDADDEWRRVLAEQVGQHYRLFFRLSYRVLRNTEAAREVCQQLVEKALARPPALRKPAAVKSWLCRIVINESRDVLRRWVVEKEAMREWMVRLQAPDTPHVNVDNREAIGWALSQLPELQRLVVSMRIMEGLSGNDVAEILECSAKNVSVQLHSGIEALRVILKEG